MELGILYIFTKKLKKKKENAFPNSVTCTLLAGFEILKTIKTLYK